MKINLLFSVLLATVVPAMAATPLQGGYSVEPLESPLFDEASVVVETTGINNWLAANIQNLSYEQMKGPREHLYYLIDSRIKHIYASTKQILPGENDPLLEVLFSWAEPLGVFGGAYAFNAVKAPSSAARTTRMTLPDGVDLSLTGDVFTLRSNFGWSLTFPYNFMIWNISDFVAIDSPRTQLVAVSTGAAKDASPVGRSQATLMFMFSPGSNTSLERYWLEKLGISATVQPAAIGVKGLQSRRVLDDSFKLHTEFTSWSNEVGSYAVVYSGIDGTYQWNRPHFIDFVRTARTDGN